MDFLVCRLGEEVDFRGGFLGWIFLWADNVWCFFFGGFVGSFVGGF